MTRGNPFSGDPLDRLAHRRGEPDLLADRLRRGARVVPVWDRRVLLRGGPGTFEPVWLDSLDGPEAGVPPEAGGVPVLLGEREGTTYVAVGVEDETAARALEARTGGEFGDLRAAGLDLAREDGAVLAYARAILTWHAASRHCGRCGAPTVSRRAGHERRCTDEACGDVRFPRTDPAIIVLVTADERCLLVNQPRWPERVHSTIAGFVEPGESLEDAVRREVDEEVGIALDGIRYHSSQPWPFPMSIMLGFRATTPEPGAARPDEHEIRQLRWLTRGDLAAALSSGSLALPSPVSISFRLIEGWFDEATAPGRLREVAAAAGGRGKALY